MLLIWNDDIVRKRDISSSRLILNNTKFFLKWTWIYDPDPFSIHGYRSIFHPWIEDPDLFSIHESRIRIHFSSMDSGSGSTFKWYDIDYINNAILKDFKTYCLLFLKHFTRFFVKKINLLFLNDSFDQFWRYFYFILLFWELWGVTKRQCVFLWMLTLTLTA